MSRIVMRVRGVSVSRLVMRVRGVSVSRLVMRVRGVSVKHTHIRTYVRTFVLSTMYITVCTVCTLKGFSCIQGKLKPQPS